MLWLWKGGHLLKALPLEGWRRSVRLLGGDWAGSITLKVQSEDDIDLLKVLLGCTVQERLGQKVVWEGLILEVRLTWEGIEYMWSLGDVYNAVSVWFFDSQNEDQPTLLPWQEDWRSIQEYGRKELILTSGRLTPDQAQALAQRTLSQKAWPYIQPTNLQKPGPNLVTLKAVGYIFTANWRYMIPTGEEETVTQRILDTLTVCDFLTPGQIATNNTLATEEPQEPRRAWERLRELVESGDYTLQVVPGRRVNYFPLADLPEYYFRQGTVYAKDARTPVPKQLVRPGYFILQGSPFNLRVLVEEVELQVTPAGTQLLRLKTGDREPGIVFLR